MPNLGGGGRPAASTRPASSSSLPAIGGEGTATRSPLLSKANLATGSQAAMVKLASYGSGPARAAALLNYQSHKGKLTLERQDGTMIVGGREVADVAASWEGSNRAPSNDVMSFKIRIDGPMTPEAAQTGLQRALKGHDYAWTFAHDGAAAHIGVVMAAASSERDDKGRLERVYGNDRSINGLHDRLEAALGWPNAFSEPRWDHSVEGATTALARLTRGGEIEAFTPDGRALREETNRIWEARLSAAGRSAPDNLNPSLEIAKSWAPNMRSRSPRDFAHVIFSAKPGADKQAFMDAARVTLAKEFAGHEYVFVMHTNRDHIHVHAAVRLTRSDGERLDPKIQHFARWRETLAHEARQRHIPMEAVRRFDQAHVPAYKLKDVRMVERGDAPDSVLRRIERVRDREVHRPSREEGWRRARETAREWRALSSERSAAALPPAPDGALRLYRFERADAAHHNALFTPDRAIAESYARPGVSGRLVYVDVPADRIGELKPSHSQPDRLFVAPRSIATLSKRIESETEATVLSFRARAEAAIGESERSPPTWTNEARPMRSVETMTASRTRMADIINRMQAVLPDDEAARQFAQNAKQLLEKADSVIAEQSRLDSHRADVQGDRYVKPEPARDLADIITHERKGDEIHYHRHSASGVYQTLAFVDRGKDIDVRDWSNTASINAALAVASQKWETLSINGTDEYKEKASRLAAEHGYKISNPELQDRINELRADIEASRERNAEGELRADAKSAPSHKPEAAQDSDTRSATKLNESQLTDRAIRAAMPEARSLRDEIDSYKDDIASARDKRYRELSIKRLADAEGRLEAFLSKPLERNAEAPDPETPLNKTPAEQELRLQDIRGRVEREAERETDQANRARAAHETNIAQGSERTPYRSLEEAQSARAAERGMENDAHRPLPADVRQSEEMANLTAQQRRLLEQEAEQRRIDIENADRANREYEQRRHTESEGESE
jgi:hypothetical protein